MPFPSNNLTQLVLDRIAGLGDAAASEYFGVSPATIAGWKAGRTSPSLAAAQKVFEEDMALNAPETWTASGKEHIQLGLPMYENVEPLNLFTLFRCCKLYGMDKVGVIPKVRTLIDEARCDIAEKFLLTGSEWLVFLDSDMILPCGSGAMLRSQGLSLPEPKASRNALERLMSHPKEYRIVAGLYRDRRGMNKVQCSLGFANQKDNERLLNLFRDAKGEDGLEEVAWAGTGFIRIHRSVFLEMKEAAKKGGPLESIAPPPPPRDKEPYGFFGRTSEWRGEDVAFGRRAQKIGIKTYIDKGLLMGHRGGYIY